MAGQQLEKGPCGESVLMVFKEDPQKGIENGGVICIAAQMSCGPCRYNFIPAQREAAAALGLQPYQAPVSPPRS